MHTLILLLVVSISIVEVFPRHVLDEVSDPDFLSLDQHDGVRKHSSDQNRHRRRRWQSGYGYDYPMPPPHPYYPDNTYRRDYNDRNQQDLLPQIVKLLEEISVYVRRPQAPPPMPQPIYIPYPVPYPVLQYSPCPAVNGTKKPSIFNRFPEMEDTNQNWGFVINKDDDTDDLNDGSRPISFNPIKPLRPMMRPPPKVEHGSTVGDSQHPSTQAPRFDEQPESLRTPSICNAAILSCCASNRPQKNVCFIELGCGDSYDNGNACSEASINSALKAFTNAYAPVP